MRRLAQAVASTTRRTHGRENGAFHTVSRHDFRPSRTPNRHVVLFRPSSPLSLAGASVRGDFANEPPPGLRHGSTGTSTETTGSGAWVHSQRTPCQPYCPSHLF